MINSIVNPKRSSITVEAGSLHGFPVYASGTSDGSGLHPKNTLQHTNSPVEEDAGGRVRAVPRTGAGCSGSLEEEELENSRSAEVAQVEKASSAQQNKCL